MEVVEGKKEGTRNYIFENYIYRLKSTYNETLNLVCTRSSCKARAVLENDNFRTTTGNHNHSADQDECELLRFKQELLLAVAKTDAPLKKVYYDTAEKYPRAASKYPYASAEWRMRRKRKTLQPPVPENLLVPRDFLESDDWRHFGQTKISPARPFYQRLLQSREGIEILVFVSPEILGELESSSAFHMDGTFKIVPQGFLSHQLTTIHAVYLNKTYAVIYALMAKRTKAAYIELLRYMKSICPNMRPTESMSDFELAERQAIAEVFPGISCKGCWFHYAQAIWKKHMQLGMCRQTDESESCRNILQMLMSLALLPSHKIIDGIRYLEDQIRRANFTETFFLLMKYMHEYWLTKVGPSVISVHGCARRTNNEVENFHLQLFTQGGKRPHPPLWDFVKILREMDRNQTLTYLAHKNGARYNHGQNKCSRLQDQRIRVAEEKLMSGVFSVGDFLKAVAHSVSSLEKQLRYENHSFTAVSSNTDRLEDENVDDPDD